MEFTRKKKRGYNGRTAKVWFSPCRQYRITWAREIFGVTVPSHYYACVRTYGSAFGEAIYWNFAGKRAAYGKFKAAVEACEKHEKLWKHALQVSEGEFKGRSERLRVIDEKARIGTGCFGNRLLASLPVWVRPKANHILMNHLFGRAGSRVENDECEDNLPDAPAQPSVEPQSDPTNLSLTTEQASSDLKGKPRRSSSKKTPTDGPASNAKASAKSTKRKTATLSKDTNSPLSMTAEPAAEAAIPIPKSSKRRTTKSSASTSKRKPIGKRSSKRSKAPVAS